MRRREAGGNAERSAQGHLDVRQRPQRLQGRQGQGTSCDAEHASEEFYDAPEEIDCGKKYEDFSGRPVDRSIRVTRQSRDHQVVCRAEVQVSTDRLTASVRDLENAALPIKQN